MKQLHQKSVTARAADKERADKFTQMFFVNVWLQIQRKKLRIKLCTSLAVCEFQLASTDTDPIFSF